MSDSGDFPPKDLPLPEIRTETGNSQRWIYNLIKHTELLDKRLKKIEEKLDAYTNTKS